MSEATSEWQISRKQLKELLKELEKWSAPATTLLSLYIPPGRPVGDVMELLRKEMSVADNVKLKKTREAVKAALTAAMDRLKRFDKVPPNGLVIFCGVNPDTEKLECYAFSPPDKVPVFFYRTDKSFHTEFLKDMVEEPEVYGLILVERGKMLVGLLKGSNIEILREATGFIPSKHHRGGQSQRRFDRLIEQAAEAFYKHAGEVASEVLLPYLEQGRLKGVLIGGPAFSKQDFLEAGGLDYRIKQKVLGLYDVADVDEHGFYELVQRGYNEIQGQKYAEALNAMEEFKRHLAKDTGYAVYGKEEVMEALRMGALKSILIPEDHPELEKIKEEAEMYGTKVIPIPEGVPEAEWFKKTFGIAGIKRFK
ncbi:peptide chain release factor 1 [Ignicoccus islandicus DSM 13165]|uniref:Peptide chain release factor subunit 1 n=1 Tax=Ignicoccus islandicus DSM 13165 TaxID=940295 RepID=A0A0U3F2N3_9CREN|nr:peptide chain release factor aRF-1 [Ignicoccus islandicus]ALU11781.1 peptide chain release factor 1 [Ignicoccus islandicus DSM 13165]